MRLWRPVLAIAATAVLASAEGVSTDLLPPASRVVAGFSVRSLLESPLIRSLGGDAAKVTTTFTTTAPLVGLNPATDIDSVVFASTGDSQTTGGLLVLRGRFHTEGTHGVRLYHGVPTFEDTSNQSALALLDDATAIAGPLSEVRAAIDRRGGGSHIAPALAKRVAELAEAHDFWAVGDLPEGFHSANPPTKDFDSVDHFEFSASLREGLQLNGEIHVKSPEKAAQMALALSMIEGMMKAQKPAPGGARFDLRTENGTLKLAVFIPEEELKKGLAAQKDRLTGMLMGQFGAAPAAPSAREISGPIARPAAGPATIVTNSRGDTVTVTLPGAK